MCDTPFKTPSVPYKRKNGNGLCYDDYNTPGKVTSDSEESTASGTESVGSTVTTSSNELSIVAQFDDLMRFMRYKRTNDVENAMMDFLDQVKTLGNQYSLIMQECKRLQTELDVKIHQNADLERSLRHARKLLDQEMKKTIQAKKERHDLEQQIAHARDVLQKDPRLREETKVKIPFMSYGSQQSLDGNNGGHTQLSAIPEINSTGSILSDFSYSRSEDELNNSLLPNKVTWKNHRPSMDAPAEPAVKKRRSAGNKIVEIAASDTVRATTTVTVNKEGPITATSIIESVPKAPSTTQQPSILKGRKSSEFINPSAPPANLVFESWARDSPLASEKNINNNNLRQHTFQQKTVVMPDACAVCEKRIRFGRAAMKCKDCRALCHVDCKDALALPCIPIMNTPNQRNFMGVIGDYTPTTPPMVPSLIIHCVNEIELRGLGELGLYRIPGSERDVKALKEKYLKGRSAPTLNTVDIHVICGTVKDFLRSLTEPLVTYKLWKDFVKAVQAQDKDDVRPALYETISELPQPNRDTLAYMILHLQKIAQTPDCKMPVSNLAKVFGPTIVGYSSDDPDPQTLMMETAQQNLVMEHLLHISSEYWSSFVNIEAHLQPSNRLQQTPSTDSLLRPATRGFFTPLRSNNEGRKKQKFFATPPINK